MLFEASWIEGFLAFSSEELTLLAAAVIRCLLHCCVLLFVDCYCALSLAHVVAPPMNDFKAAIYAHMFDVHS